MYHGFGAIVLGLALLGAASVQGAVEATTATQRLRVMTYNIHHGRGTDNKIDLPRVAAVITKANPDLVAVQEVDIKTRRSGGVDQLAELARLTGMHGRFGKGRDFEGGDYGQAVLSRRPITSLEVHPLPGPSVADERIAITAQIEGDNSTSGILFVITHLHHADEAHRLHQAKILLQLVEKRQQPAAILAGDFNAKPGSDPMNLVLKSWQDTTPEDAVTYPSDKPDRKIDWILYPRGLGWKVLSSEVVAETVASDHRPVLAEFDLSSGLADHKQ